MNGGLYIHIPFCVSKCPYCNFYSNIYNESDARVYVQKIINEFKKYNGTFDTIYFGGGTPSVLEAKFIGKIIAAAKEQFNMLPDCEITVECNPSKNMTEDFYKYSSYGVNRISLGMQSALNEERRLLGRKGTAKDVQKTINDARKAGINNISLDLMLGTPNQTLYSLNETFDFIKSVNITHISAYMLKIEEGTNFFKHKNKLNIPHEDTVCEMYLKTISEMKKIGLSQYEISNFAIKGYESRHNLKYWTLEPYLGIGPTAHSFYNGKRFYYDENFNKKEDGTGGSDFEKIMLGLRLNQGIDKKLIKIDITHFVKMGLIKENNGRISLTPNGMLISNTIISELTE